MFLKGTIPLQCERWQISPPAPIPTWKQPEWSARRQPPRACPLTLEAAWAEWSKGIKNVDERGMTLLRAAFEAGYESASNASVNNGESSGMGAA